MRPKTARNESSRAKSTDSKVEKRSSSKYDEANDEGVDAGALV